MKKMYDLRLSGGEVLLPEFGLQKVDLFISNGKISAITDSKGNLAAEETVSIPGLTVLPGAIDAHVHLGKNIAFPTTPEEVSTESAAAAAGGVTCILSYLMSAEPYETIADNVIKLMKKHSFVDFGLHFCICTEAQLQSVPVYIEKFGVSSFKYFMNFRQNEGQRLGLPGTDDGFLFNLLQFAAESNGLVCPHAENVEIIWALKKQQRAPDGNPLKAYFDSRPSFVEAEAVGRAAYLAAVTNANLYAVHVTCKEALDVLLRQKQQYNKIFIETCPHYLTHNFESNIGVVGKVNPPLRTAKDSEALWQALSLGQIDVIGSDHVPREKVFKEGDIWKASPGCPGLETLMPVLISEGYIRRHIPLQKIVNTFTSNPARIFGLSHKKGAIAIGFDADLAIVDLQSKYRLEEKNVISNAGYSLYEGWDIYCDVMHTISNGHFVKRDGKIQKSVGESNYCARNLNK